MAGSKGGTNPMFLVLGFVAKVVKETSVFSINYGLWVIKYNQIEKFKFSEF